jgi:ribonucleotide reductase beta subunit family protein with ferritin-like domain
MEAGSDVSVHADCLLVALGNKKYYIKTNTFDFGMDIISPQGKMNSFEQRVSDYAKASQYCLQ